MVMASKAANATATHSSTSLPFRPEMNFEAHSSSPLKRTKTIGIALFNLFLTGFRYERRNLFRRGPERDEAFNRTLP
jgi:hypothetical protein